MPLDWEETTQIKFAQLLEKIPVFMRPLAEKKIREKAEILAQEARHKMIMEKDLVDAFFSETPFGFHGPMKSDMASIGINYQQYGHPE